VPLRLTVTLVPALETLLAYQISVEASSIVDSTARAQVAPVWVIEVTVPVLASQAAITAIIVLPSVGVVTVQLTVVPPPLLVQVVEFC